MYSGIVNIFRLNTKLKHNSNFYIIFSMVCGPQKLQKAATELN